MCSGFYSEHFLYIGASDTINVSQRNFLRLHLEFMKADIAMPAAHRITPPSVHNELFKLQGLHTIKTHIFIKFQRSN